ELPAGASELADSLDAETPGSLTPTAPALQGALAYMQGRDSDRPERSRVVVLATDGYPTQCGVRCATDRDCRSGTCLDAVCSPLSLDEIAALAARYASGDPPVFTAVLGIAGGLSIFQRVADAG